MSLQIKNTIATVIPKHTQNFFNGKAFFAVVLDDLTPALSEGEEEISEIHTLGEDLGEVSL